MKLILAEKPSVAADFARALGARREDGYFQSNDYIITFCVGHLLELCEPEDYDESYKKWSIDSLPIIPSPFKYKALPSTKKQLSIIKTLLSSKYDEIILATDAGREGELIGREVFSYCKLPSSSKIKRFWSSEALTPEVIKSALSRVKDDSEYDRLYSAGHYRQLSDWLVGINFSRYFSCSLKDVFSFGRVQTSVLNLIVGRQREIDAFVSKPYYQLTGLFEKNTKQFKGTFKQGDQDKFDKRSDIESLLDSIKSAKEGTVSSIDKKSVKKSPPLLMSLTALQKEANRLFGYSADKTLSICQALYESHKCLSYPRTPSRVLAASNVDLVKDKLSLLSKKYHEHFPALDNSLVTQSNKRVFNDAKLEDHHALIPLAPIPETCIEEEKNIYFLVLKSFSACFHADYEYEAVKAVIDVSGLGFHSSGRSVTAPGWTLVYKPAKDESSSDEDDSAELPELAQGDRVLIHSTDIVEKKTTPPPFFTEASLLAAMENPGKFSADENTDFKNVGLGTQATRAAIIETLLRRFYITRAKKNLLPTKKAIHFIESIGTFPSIKHFINVDETARWEKSLESSPEPFMKDIIDFVTSCTRELKATTLAQYQKELPDIGKCLVCGSPLIENDRSYYCSTWKSKGCNFHIWKTIAGGNVTHEDVKALLSGKSSRMKKFISKAGKSFESRISFDEKYNVIFVKEGSPLGTHSR